jgi:SAM-dependent methyltransferase
MSSNSINFDRAADFYDETRGFPPGEVPQIAALFVHAGNLSPSSRVLEIGVGTGRIALPLAAHVREIVGVDLSRAMLDRLRAKQTSEPVQPLEGDVTRLPLASGAFDAVAATHIFHLIPAWELALEEAARVLRPGGVLLVGRNEDERRETALGPLWEAWDKVAGLERRKTVGLPFERFETFLDELNWHPVGEPLTHEYPVYHTPAMFLDRLNRRVWSRMWILSDETVAQGIAAVQAVIEREGMELEQPLALSAHFTIRAYLPPDR